MVVSVDRGAALRLGPRDGKVRWRTRFATADGAPGEPVYVAGRYVVIPTGSGVLHVLDSAVGRPIQAFRPGAGVLKSLPTDLENSRKSSVTCTHTVCRPKSCSPVLQ